MQQKQYNRKLVSVSCEIYSWLFKQAAALQAESGDPVTIDATMRNIRDRLNKAEA